MYLRCWRLKIPKTVFPVELVPWDWLCLLSVMYRRGSLGGWAGHRAACNRAQAVWFRWNLLQILPGFQQAGISPPELMGTEWKQSALPESPHSYLHIWLAVVWKWIKGEIFFSDRVSETYTSFWGGIVCTWFLTSLFGVIWRITDSLGLPSYIYQFLLFLLYKGVVFWNKEDLLREDNFSCCFWFTISMDIQSLMKKKLSPSLPSPSISLD